MKTELEVAKENIKEFNRTVGFKKTMTHACWIRSNLKIANHIVLAKINNHKATCKRWLEYFEKEEECCSDCKCIHIEYNNKGYTIKDLEEAIKLYSQFD